MKTKASVASTACPKAIAASLRTACATRLLPVLLLWAMSTRAQAQYTYTTNNGMIVITGYTGPGGALIIPDTINGLSVTDIWNDAFYRSTNLTTVTIPNSIINIGDGAFNYCPGLTNVTLGDGVTSIGQAAFESTGLTSVTIPGLVTNIGPWAFAECSGLTDVTIGNGVTSIGDYAFYGCPSLASATIPNSVTYLGAEAFENCTRLASVTIGDSVTSIGVYAFADCPNLASVTIPNSVTNIGAEAFYYCFGLTNVTIGNGVTSIASYAFAYCHSLAGVTLGNRLTSIGAYAFDVCTSLASVAIPNNVASIGYGAFFAGYSMTNLTIGSGVTNLADYAFGDCYSLGSVYFQGNAPAVSGSAFLSDTNAAVHYLPGTTGWGSTFGGWPTVLWNVATATPTVVNDSVVGATVTDGGFGYTNTPSVRIIGGGGTGAQAVAVVSNGTVIVVSILNPGDGYTNQPAIVIAPPFIPQPTMGIAAMSLLSFTNLAVGAEYQLQSSSGGAWDNLDGPAATASSTFTQYVAGTARPNGYRLALSPLPEQAYAAAQVVDGLVVGATVTSGGSGYGSNVVVTILSDGGGTNATAIATVSGGVVTGIAITSAGGGYAKPPTIVISSPPANALWPTVTQAMKLDSESLSPYDNYQLEFTPVAGGAWSTLGNPFTPTSTTSTQYLNVSGTAGFFRMNYVP